MRRTGYDLLSPATARDACGGGGMTNEALMGFSQVAGYFFSGGRADRRQRRWAGRAVLPAEERGVAPAPPQQVVMTSALDDLAALDHQNGVGMHDGVQPVGDHDGGAALAEVLD